jgi:dynein heavy chain
VQFDEFFRQLILGFNLAYPKPKTFKLQRNQLFPETGTVFDFVFERKDSGHWVTWMDIVNKKSLQIAPNAKVSTKKAPLLRLFMIFDDMILTKPFQLSHD